MTEAQLLDGQAFNRLVLENDLTGKTWEQNGYIYAGMKGVAGWELYRTYGPKWKMLYQARRVVTQSAGGGGALHLNITVATGFEAELVSMYVIGAASAGSTLTVQLEDEDGALAGLLGFTAAGASRANSYPTIGTAPQHGNSMQSKNLRIGPGQTLKTAGSAALQTETHTMYISLLLPISATEATVVWSTTGSAGTPTLAASTISAANTLQAVLLP